MEVDESPPLAMNGAAEDRHTLYINNLHEKVSQDDLRESMRCIFGQFGKIIDIVSRRTYKLRGQAWVVFEKEEDAADALKFMQGFPFFNKPIKIAYAKTKSDAVAKLDGSYNEEEVESRKQARRQAHEAAKAAAAAPGTTAAPDGAAAEAGPAADATRTLFVENIPNEANEGMLLLVFQRFPGLKEVRMVPHKPGIAFVEYDNDEGAAAALTGLQGFKLATDKPMMLSYAKQ